MKFIRDLFMNVENSNWDIVRVLVGLSFVGLLAGCFYAIAKGATFDPIDYATACAVIVGTSGGGIAVRDISRAKAKRDGEKLEG